MATGRQQSFFYYFKTNMNELGLDVPASWNQAQADVANVIGTILASLKTLGKDATIGELVGATTGLEKLMVIAVVRVSAYVGAAIGSFAVATGRYAAHGTSISDVMMEIHQHGITPPAWLYNHLALHPEILDQRRPARSAYAFRARR